MPLEQRSDDRQVSRIAGHHGMRIADVDGHERDACDLFLGPDDDGAELLFDERRLQHPRPHLAVADADDYCSGAAACGEPAGSDACPVARHLRLGAVGIPDHDLEAFAIGGQHFDEPVGVAHERADEVRRERVLSDEVDVLLCVPTR